MSNILKKISEIILKIIYVKKFKDHNRRIFKYNEPYKKEIKKSLILVDFNHFCFDHIGISYLLYCLRNKYRCAVKSYFSYTVVTYNLKRNYIQSLKFLIGKFFKLKNFGIYNSLGINDFYFPKPTLKHYQKADKFYSKFLKKNNNREKVLNLKIDNILFGDLLYDSYIKKNYDIKPTIFVNDKKFLSFAYEFILNSIIWIELFKKYKIKAVIGSQTVYNVGVPLRIAIYKNIDAFVVNSENLTKLNKKLPLQYCEFHDYKKRFKNIPLKDQKEGLRIAKNKFLSRLRGEFSPDYHYATRSPFKKQKIKKNLIFKKTKKRNL